MTAAESASSNSLAAAAICSGRQRVGARLASAAPSTPSWARRPAANAVSNGSAAQVSAGTRRHAERLAELRQRAGRASSGAERRRDDRAHLRAHASRRPASGGCPAGIGAGHEQDVGARERSEVGFPDRARAARADDARREHEERRIERILRLGHRHGQRHRARRIAHDQRARHAARPTGGARLRRLAGGDRTRRSALIRFDTSSTSKRPAIDQPRGRARRSGPAETPRPRPASSPRSRRRRRPARRRPGSDATTRRRGSSPPPAASRSCDRDDLVQQARPLPGQIAFASASGATFAAPRRPSPP